MHSPHSRATLFLTHSRRRAVISSTPAASGGIMHDLRVEFQGSYDQKRTSTKHIVVHHAAALYPQATARGDIQAVHRYHLSKGWGGIAYTCVIAEQSNGGPVEAYQCSDLDTLRYHVAHHNHDSIGVSCLTNFGSSIPEYKWIEKLAEVLRYLRVRYPHAEIVGHKEIAVKGYETSCPGTRWLEWKPRLLALVNQITPPPSPPPSPLDYTADTPILGASTCTPEQAARYIVGRGGLYSPYDVRSILASYWHWCELAGLNPHIAIGQMCHETDVLRAWWSDRPRRNSCGYGVNDETSATKRSTTRTVEGIAYPEWAKHGNSWERGMSFPTWDLSARAHVGRLAAYAVPQNGGSVDQYALIAYALALRTLAPEIRGIAPTIGGLGGKKRWAPSTGYWQGIARHMRAIGAVKVP